MRHSNPREFIGVDVGSVRVGLARGSDVARIAEPLITLPAAGAIKQLADILDRHGAAGVVVGLPRGLDGQDTPQTQYVRDWVEQARRTLDLPFYWQDEALTSRQAAGKIQSSKSKAQKTDIDAAAAAVILQDFLDTPESERVRC